MSKAYSIYLFTNRNMMIFDREGNQLPEEQGMVSCYNLNREGLAPVIDQAEEFFIAKWRDWTMRISKKELQYLLGMRTLQMDLDENERVMNQVKGDVG